LWDFGAKPQSFYFFAKERNMNLFEYIYGLAVGTLNNKGSKHWMPKVLQETKNPDSGELILPLKVDKCDAVILSEVMQKLFCDNWYSFACSYASNVKHIVQGFDPEAYCGAPHPSDPYTHITVKNMTIDGLFNVCMADTAKNRQTSCGYVSMLTARFNAYEELKRVKISGNFTLSQKVCAVDKGGTEPTKDKFDMGELVSWPEKQIDVTGSVDLYATDLFLEVISSMKIIGSGIERRLSVKVLDVAVYSKDEPSPLWTIDEGTLKVDSDPGTQANVSIMSGLVPEVFADAEAQEYITDIVNKSLSGCAEDLSLLMTNFINGSLDSSLGGVQEGELPGPEPSPLDNPGDQYIFDRVRYALCLPDGKFYLPVFVAQTDGVTEPYKIERIDLPSFDAEVLHFSNVCLTCVSVLGLTNISAAPADMYIRDGKFYVKAGLSELNPPPLKMSGDFSMEAEDVCFTGKLYVTVEKSSLSLTSRFSADNDLVIDHENLSIALKSMSDFSIKLEMDSKFTGIINSFINESDEIKGRIISGVNDGLAGYLPVLSQETTKKVRAMLKEQLM
jgi:hypothetical protein